MSSLVPSFIDHRPRVPPGHAPARRRRGAARTARSVLAALIASVANGAGPATATEREFEVSGPNGPLRGTLAVPDDDAARDGSPAVLILPGSGPIDRDGNSPLGIEAAPYRLIAEALAERGTPSLRADKRGLFGSVAAVASADDVLVSDYVADTRAWSAALAAETNSDCIVLLGHSEGALIALATAANAFDPSPEGNADANVAPCALILVASPGRPLADVLREQLAANPAYAPLLDEAEAAINALERGERVDGASLSPELAPLFRPPVQGFLIELLGIDPPALLADLELPVLIVQGERDIQVASEDAERLADAAPDATLALLPDANHVLKAVPPDDRAANVAAYRDPSLPLAAGVAEAIANFVDAL